MPKRREHKRKPITSTAVIRVLREDSEPLPFNGLVMNISFGGAEFSATQSTKVSDEIEAVLWFFDDKGGIIKEVTVQGQVVWETKMPPFYIFGVKFKEMNKKDHPELISFLEAEEED